MKVPKHRDCPYQALGHIRGSYPIQAIVHLLTLLPNLAGATAISLSRFPGRWRGGSAGREEKRSRPHGRTRVFACGNAIPARYTIEPRVASSLPFPFQEPRLPSSQGVARKNCTQAPGVGKSKRKKCAGSESFF